MTTKVILTILDTFTRAYVECALWSSNDDGESLDENYGVGDIAPETLARMVADCEAFQAENRQDLDDCDLTVERQGHDFWLNRNGHGTGFWDEGYRKDERVNKALERLDEASRAAGSCELYVGDDGMIYAM